MSEDLESMARAEWRMRWWIVFGMALLGALTTLLGVFQVFTAAFYVLFLVSGIVVLLAGRGGERRRRSTPSDDSPAGST